MKLYKYRDLVNAWNVLDIIANKRLYLSPLDALNDPMEIKTDQAKAVINTHLNINSIDYTRPPKESELTFAKTQGLTLTEYENANLSDLIVGLSIQSYSRICSLSADPTSIAMWSHYSNGHQGICLVFEINSALPVSYWSAERIDRQFSAAYLTRLFNRFGTGEDAFMKKYIYSHEKLKRLYAIKQCDWAYEREWRIFGHGKGYHLLKEEEYLIRILLGTRISSFHYEILRQIVPSNVPLVKTKVVAGEVIETT